MVKAGPTDVQLYGMLAMPLGLLTFIAQASQGLSLFTAGKKQSPARSRALPNTEQPGRSEAALVQVAKQLGPDVDVRIGADDAALGHGEVGRPRRHLVTGRLTVRRIVSDRGPTRGKGRRRKCSEDSSQRCAGGEKFFHCVYLQQSSPLRCNINCFALRRLAAGA
jgi:hypothetical protein